MLRLATTAMGTRFEIVLVAGPSSWSEADLCAAGEIAIDDIDDWHRRLSRFAPDSLVSHINRTAALTPVALDAQMWRLFRDAVAVWSATGGAFDITVAPALVAHGFSDSAVPARGGRAQGHALVLDDDARTVSFREAGVSLDFGAIGKGHALDCAAERLRDCGVTSAFLQGGTSSGLAIGRPPGERGWRVALGPGLGAAVVTLADAAFSLSDAEAQRSACGHRHLVDPRQPVDGIDATDEMDRTDGPTRALVTGPSARLADAWSTGLVVLGHIPETMPSGYHARFLTADDAGDHPVPPTNPESAQLSPRS